MGQICQYFEIEVYLIRESNVISAGDAQAEIAKTASAGYLTSDAMVNPGYLNTAGKQNPYWGSLWSGCRWKFVF